MRDREQSRGPSTKNSSLWVWRESKQKNSKRCRPWWLSVGDRGGTSSRACVLGSSDGGRRNCVEQTPNGKLCSPDNKDGAEPRPPADLHLQSRAAICSTASTRRDRTWTPRQHRSQMENPAFETRFINTSQILVNAMQCEQSFNFPVFRRTNTLISKSSYHTRVLDSAVLLTLSVKPPTLALLLEQVLHVEDDAARSGHRATWKQGLRNSTQQTWGPVARSLCSCSCLSMPTKYVTFSHF